ncbi:hypothetical protein SLA2020_347560 [Shorea laevis]
MRLTAGSLAFLTVRVLVAILKIKSREQWHWHLLKRRNCHFQMGGKDNEKINRKSAYQDTEIEMNLPNPASKSQLRIKKTQNQRAAQFWQSYGAPSAFFHTFLYTCALLFSLILSLFYQRKKASTAQWEYRTKEENEMNVHLFT